MKAIKGIYENGQVKLLNSPIIKGKQEILVIFPNEAEPSPSLQKSKELFSYFVQRRKKIEPIDCSVKELIEEGRAL